MKTKNREAKREGEKTENLGYLRAVLFCFSLHSSRSSEMRKALL